MNQEADNQTTADKVRAATVGQGDPGTTLKTVGDAFDNVGKVGAGVAAVGGITYLVALLSVGVRLDAAGLPSNEVLSALPRDQLLVGGIVELLVTLVGAAILVILAIISRRMLSVQIVLLAAIMLILPFSVLAVVWLATILALIALFRFWRTPPTTAVIAILALAALLLTYSRQAEFPSPFAGVKVALKAEDADNGGSAERVPPISGKYIGATATDVLVGVQREQREAVQELLQGEKVPDSLVMIPRARLDQVVLSSSPAVEPPESLAARLGFELTCLIPTCRWGNSTLITPQ